MHKKNPGQHAGDLEMLANHDEAKYALSGEIDCIRVDGATNEGRHISRSNLCGQSDIYVMERFAH